MAIRSLSFARLPTWMRIFASLVIWIGLALVVAAFVTAFVIKSYRVDGPSMKPTLQNGDVILASELTRSLNALSDHSYIPKRGQLVVFKNPFYNQGDPNAFVVKRVIGLPGEHVVVRDSRITIFNTANQNGFNPDASISGPQSPTSGNVDRIVPDGELFVVGDNRQGKNSLDSRNGMSTVPIGDVQGIVVLRLWPLLAFRTF